MTSGSPDWSPRIVSSGSSSENKKASVTATEIEVAFSQTVLSFLVYNEGVNDVHLSRATGVDTNDFKIPTGGFFSVDVPTSSIFLICASGETATCFIVGVF